MQVIETKLAIRNRQSHRPQSIWSTRGEDVGVPYELTVQGNGGDRAFKDFCAPQIRPSFQFNQNVRIFCSGSCFAREIELALYNKGIAVLSWSPDIQIPNNAFHRYNTQTILSEFSYALNDSYDEANVVRVRDGWADFTGYPIVFPTPEAALEQRRAVIAQHRRVVEADLVVVTLGLVEAWYDRRTGRYMNTTPYPLFHSSYDDVELRITDYAENIGALRMFEESLAVVNPNARILVTVSPVPFADTFSGDDVLVANMYSKSVLRAVAQDWARSSQAVDYFPSYEMVMLSSPESAWLPDKRHVQRSHVEKIVEAFLNSYVTSDCPTMVC